jgi:RNA polymerase sporulation-specific sigma factor
LREAIDQLLYENNNCKILTILDKIHNFEDIENKIDQALSSFEKQVLNRYIQGESYVDIAQKLDSPVKSVDNAIQRIRKKAIKCLNDED